MLNRIDSSTARNHPVKRLPWLALATLGCALSLTQGVRAQEDSREQQVLSNIAPVAQVCLANEPCVGQRADGGESEMAAAESASAQATAASQGQAQGGAAASAAFDPAAAYQLNCMACHTTGAAGAPEIGDDAAWQERMQKGMDAVMQNAINGIGAMPAMGLCMSCSHEQLREIVDYMLDQ